MRRTEGDETWLRIKMWLKGQKAAERLSAHILAAEKFESVDPSHPLGGRDGLKDIVCTKDDINWIAACYFPKEQKSFKDLKSKFTEDFKGVEKNDVEGFIFITNQELTLGQRSELLKHSNAIEIEIYHLERISHILNRPENYGIRLEFLDIELLKEEQFSYFVSKDIELKKLSTMVESLMSDYSRYKSKSENEYETRSDDEVSIAMEELLDKIWYNRHLNLRYRIENYGEYVNPEIWEGALNSACRVEEKYGIENLGPWDDFEWGMLNGKLSALRWFFGDEWDMLDT